jgi:hypothetical protein
MSTNFEPPEEGQPNIPPPAGAEEAHGHYMEVALKRWPQGEGWLCHSVVMGEFDTRWTVDDGRLQVTHELKGKAEIGPPEIFEVEESQFSL